ncbi:MAG: ABC transporter substrate-binding protein, partial [Dehalococcoidia bacterium]
MPRATSRMLLAALVTLVAALLLAACNNGDDPDGSGAGSPEVSPTAPDKITFMAGFKPQANLPFVGAYVAQEKGFFAQQNLEVEIRHVSTPGENFKFLSLGQVQFSTADAATVIERAGDDPPLGIVAIALIGQRGQQGFAVLADSGIDTPKDWDGKRAGYKGTQPTPDFLAILNTEGV